MKKAVRVGLSEKMTFEQRLGGSERIIRVNEEGAVQQ